MLTTRIFQNGNSQAIRIPQEIKTDRKEYCINKIGDIYIAYPADAPWAADLMISSITVFELEYGAEKSNWGREDQAQTSNVSFAFYHTAIQLR